MQPQTSMFLPVILSMATAIATLLESGSPVRSISAWSDDGELPQPASPSFSIGDWTEPEFGDGIFQDADDVFRFDLNLERSPEPQSHPQPDSKISAPEPEKVVDSAKNEELRATVSDLFAMKDLIEEQPFPSATLDMDEFMLDLVPRDLFSEESPKSAEATEVAEPVAKPEAAPAPAPHHTAAIFFLEDPDCVPCHNTITDWIQKAESSTPRHQRTVSFTDSVGSHQRAVSFSDSYQTLQTITTSGSSNNLVDMEVDADYEGFRFAEWHPQSLIGLKLEELQSKVYEIDAAVKQQQIDIESRLARIQSASNVNKAAPVVRSRAQRASVDLDHTLVKKRKAEASSSTARTTAQPGAGELRRSMSARGSGTGGAAPRASATPLRGSTMARSSSSTRVADAARTGTAAPTRGPARPSLKRVLETTGTARPTSNKRSAPKK